MKPVDQTIFGMPLGNCFQACVASILELPLEAVPNFNEYEHMWFPEFCEWAQLRGLNPVICDVRDKDEWPSLCGKAGYYIASGPGPRGIFHAVVYNGPEMVHDPHPSREGIEEIHDIILIAQMDPA